MVNLNRLPGPREDLWEWQLRGRCRQEGAAFYFHPEGERGPRHRAREAAARAICASCPVILECRTYALNSREPYGVWGGLSENDRAEILGRGLSSVAAG